jgi:hypothetical protein
VLYSLVGNKYLIRMQPNDNGAVLKKGQSRRVAFEKTAFGVLFDLNDSALYDTLLRGMCVYKIK